MKKVNLIYQDEYTSLSVTSVHSFSPSSSSFLPSYQPGFEAELSFLTKPTGELTCGGPAAIFSCCGLPCPFLMTSGLGGAIRDGGGAGGGGGGGPDGDGDGEGDGKPSGA